jgi:hypothetical protein
VASEYRVNCECGKSHQVTTGDAGSQLHCECGRTVDVPELHILRATAGEPTISPELAIELLLKDGKIPGDGNCICCGVPSNEKCYVRIVCERGELRAEGWRVNAWYTVLGLLLGWIVVRREWQPESVRGRHVEFRLPILLCSNCAPSMTRSKIPDTLRKIDVYRQLLDKYPKSSIGKLEYNPISY